MSPGFFYLSLLLFLVAFSTGIGFHYLDERKKKQALSSTASEKHSEMMERGETITIITITIISHSGRAGGRATSIEPRLSRPCIGYVCAGLRISMESMLVGNNLRAGLQINVLQPPAATQDYGITVPAGISPGQTICVQMPSGEEARGAALCVCVSVCVYVVRQV